MPGGTTAERPGGTAGQVRFNSDTGFMEYYTGFDVGKPFKQARQLRTTSAVELANQIPVQNGPSSHDIHYRTNGSQYLFGVVRKCIPVVGEPSWNGHLN
jgi:hypothetical protein